MRDLLAADSFGAGTRTRCPTPFSTRTHKCWVGVDWFGASEISTPTFETEVGLDMKLSPILVALIFAIVVLVAAVCGLVTGLLCMCSRVAPAAAGLRGVSAFGSALAIQCALVGALAMLS